jgi:hypothetical protein
VGGIIVGLTIAVVGWAWISFWFIIPACTASQLRYRMWRIRDDIKDALLDQRLTDGPLVQRLLRGVEGGIRVAPRLRFSSFAVYLLLRDRSDVDKRHASDLRLLESLPSEEKQLLLGYMDSFNRACTRRVLLGTPSGWILGVPTFGLVAFLRVLSARIRRSLDDHRTPKPTSVSSDETERRETLLEDVKEEASREMPVGPAVELLVIRGARFGGTRELEPLCADVG